VLSDGSLVVADYGGNRVCTVSPDRKSVKTILGLDTPAILAVDLKRGLLYVPMLKQNKVFVYKLAAAKAE
jgi:DNA-binding beta-propeller fold protein YncE